MCSHCLHTRFDWIAGLFCPVVSGKAYWAGWTWLVVYDVAVFVGVVHASTDNLYCVVHVDDTLHEVSTLRQVGFVQVVEL